MKNSIVTFVFLLLFLIPKSVISQEINDLETVVEVEIQDVEDAFELRHDFSEIIYNSLAFRKDGLIVDLDNKSFQEILSSTRYPLGTWGNGNYTALVDDRNIRGSREQLWNVYKNKWIGLLPDNTNLSDPPSYQSDYPLIWDTGRRILAYIHMFKYDNKEVYKTRVKEGLNYLIDNQIESSDNNINGGFESRPERKDRNDFRIDITSSQIEEQHSAIATRALAEGYMFLNNIGDSSLNDELLISMEQAGQYFLNRKWNVIADYQPVNASAFVVWAMAGLYKATHNIIYLNHCIEVINFRLMREYQRQDGSWKSGLPTSCVNNPTDNCLNYQWHDSRSNYHGIILKAFADVYGIIPDYESVFKPKLRTAIVNSINHLINYNSTTPDPTITQTINNWNNDTIPAERINVNSRIHPTTKRILNFHRADDCFNGLGACAGAIDPKFRLESDPYALGNQILQGLIYAKKYLNFSPQDTQKINSLLNGIVQNITSDGYISNFNPGVEMLGLSLYLNTNYRTLDYKNNIGLFNKSNKKITIYKNNTYNGTFLVDNKIDTQLTYDFAITGNFDQDDNQEIAVYNRNGATRNGGQPSPGWISIFDIDKSGDLKLSGGIYTGYSGFESMVSSDFDGDCVDEIILFDKINQRIVGYENNEYGANSIFNIDIPSTLDFDLMTTMNIDSNPDKELAFYSKSGDSNGLGFVSIFKYVNNTTLSNPAAIRIGFDYFDEMKSIDIDNDGKEELALYSESQKSIKIYKKNTYNKSPVFAASTPSNMQFQLMQVGDFDNDNTKEIALYSNQGATSGGNICEGWVAIFNPQGFYTLNWTGSVCVLKNGYTSLLNIQNDVSNQNCSTNLKTRIPLNPKLFDISQQEIILFPNPVSNELNILLNNSIDVNNIDINTDVKVYDLSYKLISIKSIKKKNNSLVLGLEDLKTGMYILKIQSGEHKIETKIIKQ